MTDILDYETEQEVYEQFRSSELEFLHVPYSRKWEAKELGAKWSASKNQWYIELDHLNAPALINEFSTPIIKKPKIERTYLSILYDEREFAKSLGAMFDGGCKKWYALSNHKNYDELIKLYEYSPTKEADSKKQKKEIIKQKAQKILTKNKSMDENNQ
jgi:hypothetical protein